MKTRKQSQKSSRESTKSASGRAWRHRRTGLWLREARSSDFDHPLAMALGAVMRKWRVRYGFSAYEVAQRAKISRQTLADAEQANGWFSVCLAARICDAMGLGFLDAVEGALRMLRRFTGKKRPV